MQIDFSYSQEILFQTSLILKSFKHWMKRDLIDSSNSPKEMAKALFEAPFVLVSHGIEADPILNYGNRAALDLWEMSWSDFTKTPSRLTAEPMHQREREEFLKAVHQNGFVENYEGIRISKTEKRFRIKSAIVWNLLDDHQKYVGQAAMFDQWGYL